MTLPRSPMPVASMNSGSLKGGFSRPRLPCRQGRQASAGVSSRGWSPLWVGPPPLQSCAPVPKGLPSLLLLGVAGGRWCHLVSLVAAALVASSACTAPASQPHLQILALLGPVAGHGH